MSKDLNSDAMSSDAQRYSQLMRSLQIEGIRLLESTVRSSVDSLVEGKKIEVGSQFVVRRVNEEGEDNRVEVIARLALSFTEQGQQEPFGIVDTTFLLGYIFESAPSPAHLERFLNQNVPLNVWPFLREYVSNTVTRMGWSAFTLPAFTVPSPEGVNVSSETPAKPKRAPRKPKTPEV